MIAGKRAQSHPVDAIQQLFQFLRGWNAIDSELISQRIVVTRPELNGKKLGALRLRNHYWIIFYNFTRCNSIFYISPTNISLLHSL